MSGTLTTFNKGMLVTLTTIKESDSDNNNNYSKN